MCKTKLVAEIGINHNGDISVAKSMIAVAKNYGIEYVKFQKRDIDSVYTQEFLDSPRVSKWGTTQRDQKQGLEFSKEDYDEIDAYCKELGVKWFASPWDVKSVEFLKQYDMPFIKVASASLTNIPLLEAIAETNMPVIISTGMSTKEEVETAMDILGNSLEYILWCKSTYPTEDTDMNMLGIETLMEEYGRHFKIGFSNHSKKIIYTVMAYLMKAEMIEFHFTLDRNMAGSDQAASIGITGLDRIMNHIKSIEDGWGDGKIDIAENEIPVMKKLRG